MKLIDLGFAMARLKKSGDPKNPVRSITIVNPSLDEENHYTPSESVTIYGDPALIALRDALNEAYPVEATITANN